MPIYEYQCDKCSEKVEKMQKISDLPLESCEKPECGGKLNKLISNSGIQFKGSGWYVNDYSDKFKKSESSEPTKKSSKDSESGGKPACADTCPVACNKSE